MTVITIASADHPSAQARGINVQQAVAAAPSQMLVSLNVAHAEAAHRAPREACPKSGMSPAGGIPMAVGICPSSVPSTRGFCCRQPRGQRMPPLVGLFLAVAAFACLGGGRGTCGPPIEYGLASARPRKHCRLYHFANRMAQGSHASSMGPVSSVGTRMQTRRGQAFPRRAPVSTLALDRIGVSSRARCNNAKFAASRVRFKDHTVLVSADDRLNPGTLRRARDQLAHLQRLQRVGIRVQTLVVGGDVPLWAEWTANSAEGRGRRLPATSALPCGEASSMIKSRIVGCSRASSRHEETQSTLVPIEKAREQEGSHDGE